MLAYGERRLNDAQMDAAKKNLIGFSLRVADKTVKKPEISRKKIY